MSNTRNNAQEWLPSEKAIMDAVDKVEAMGADEKLTNAVIKLSEAKELVSQYIEEQQSAQGGVDTVTT